MATPLAQEQVVFERNVPQWRETNPGQYVLIKGDHVEGFFQSLDSAFRAGTEKYGLDDFFIQQIVSDQHVHVTFLGQSLMG